MDELAIETEHPTESSLAEARRARHDGVEYRLDVIRRTCNYAQHLRSRRLLLQRLGEILLQLSVGFANAVDVSPHLRSGRTKLATVRPALRPFARQGHPRSPHAGRHKPR